MLELDWPVLPLPPGAGLMTASWPCSSWDELPVLDPGDEVARELSLKGSR